MLNTKNKIRKPKNLKEALKGKLTKKEFSFLRTAFDSLGNIAILEIRPELVKKEKIIGEALLLVNTQFETVCKKTGAHKGKFRAKPVKVIAGKKNRTANYRESGCVFKISLGNVFFSPRLGTERLRIAKQIKKGEEVAALFAGVGPFPIVFAKNSLMKKAVAIELNSKAVRDMEENIISNKMQGKVIPVLGDVNDLVKKYKGKFDRAVMPLPKGGEDFLETTIKYIKPKGGIIHYYQFVSREKPFKVPLEQIKAACGKAKRKFRIKGKRKVRDYAPDIIQVVIDFKVWQ